MSLHTLTTKECTFAWYIVNVCVYFRSEKTQVCDVLYLILDTRSE